MEEDILYKSGTAQSVDYKLLGSLNSLLIASMLLCDVFIFKTVMFFNYSLALSGVIFPVTSLIMICINEVYGHRCAAQSLLNLIIAQIFFLLGLFFLHKLPSPPGHAENMVNAYNIIFNDIWRVMLSSPVGILVTLYLSSMINSKLKIYFIGKFLIPRFMINCLITTAILVSIIYPINFYNILPINKILGIALHTYIYKIIASFIALLASFPLVSFMKNIEKKYIFDINISFNPLKTLNRENYGVNMYDSFKKNN